MANKDVVLPVDPHKVTITYDGFKCHMYSSFRKRAGLTAQVIKDTLAVWGIQVDDVIIRVMLKCIKNTGHCNWKWNTQLASRQSCVETFGLLCQSSQRLWSWSQLIGKVLVI